MKSSLGGISAIVLIAATFALGCGKSPNEAGCAKANECGSLQGKTEAQCVADADKETNAIRADVGCKDIADKYDPYIECTTSLSCTELKDEKTVEVKCKQQIADLLAAALLDFNTCKAGANLPGGGASASVSTGTTEPSGSGSGGGAGGAGGAGSSSDASSASSSSSGK